VKRSLKIKAAICGVICLSAGSVYAGTYAVPSQYATIQAAINAASSNSVINVAPGTYNERLSFSTKMMLTINGTGGAAATIIDGGSTGPILAVGPMSMAGMPITMNGFTFQNGYSSINGGVANLAATSELVILNSIVTQNQGGTGGAFSVNGGNLKIRNSVIYNNTAINTGSAVYVATGKAYLVNDTITGNTSADGAAINQQYGATVSGINDIVYGNIKVDGTAGTPIFNDPLTTTFTYSDIEGGFTGTGNIDVTPGFVDPAAGNYQLATGSAAIDSGIVSSSSLLPTVATDLLGAARPQGAGYDMGAYEYAAPVLPPVDGVCGSSNGGTFTIAPTTGLCSTGTASAVTGAGPFAWTCDGSNGGTAASCSAQLQVVTPPADVTPPTASSIVTNGTSGSTATITVTFSENVSITKSLGMVVKIGTFNTSVSGTGSVFTIRLMSCCQSLLKPGVVYTLTIPAGSFRDSAGNLNAVITAPVSFGTAPVPVNGTCGSSNGSFFLVAPSANLCTAGTASAVSGTGPFAWTCGGSNGGTTASCSAQLQAPPADVTAPIFSSIVANGRVVSITFSEPVTAVTPAATLGGRVLAYSSVSGNTATFQIKTCCTTLTAGATYALTIPAGAFKDAAGNPNAAVSVSVIPTPLPAVNGACGSSNGAFFLVAPTSNLCSTGTPSAVSGAGPFAWTCGGSNGGTTASCSAQLQAAPPADVTAPTAVSTVVTGTSISSDVVKVTFSEAVTSTNKTITIGTAQTTYTVSGSVVSFKIKSCCLSKVKVGSTYNLVIPAGSFKDAAGNLNAAISIPVKL
jgi:hypothetical protein